MYSFIIPLKHLKVPRRNYRCYMDEDLYSDFCSTAGPGDQCLWWTEAEATRRIESGHVNWAWCPCGLMANDDEAMWMSNRLDGMKIFIVDPQAAVLLKLRYG